MTQANYGRKVWSQLNREFSAFSILPKRPWERSGWRVITDRPSFTVGGGVAENATLPETTKPAFQHIAAKPKTIVHNFDMSEIAMSLADKDDGLGDLRAVLKEEMGKHHAEHINKMLLTPLECLYQAGTHPTADLVDNDLTSLYKIVASEAEFDACCAANSAIFSLRGATLCDDVLYELYGETRDVGSSWMNAYVDYGDYSTVSSGGTGRRNLTLNMINTALRELQIRGGIPKIILTGYDTILALGELLQAQERYLGATEVLPTHNGVRGVRGREVGYKVATYHDIPIIPCKDMGTTGEGAGISDIFILDTDYIFFCTLKPTEYFEGGVDSGDPFGVGKLGNCGLYRTIGETICTFIKGQGKITNIQRE